MKAVILAGGMGTRISEETNVCPKPMVEIGGRPILWHIMKIYSHYGVNDFVICLGYKGYYIKEYFANYWLHQSNVTIDVGNNKTEAHDSASEPWRVSLIDTGIGTMTGARLKRIQKYTGDETFLVTYGDGVADIDINNLVEFHRSHGKCCTMTSTQRNNRYGILQTDERNMVDKFTEKPFQGQDWINGGFFVCEQGVFDYIDDDPYTVFERKPLENLARDGELYAYKHSGFWQCMDTLRDKVKLEEMWRIDPKWKVWAD